MRNPETYYFLHNMRERICDLIDINAIEASEVAFENYIKISKILWDITAPPTTHTTTEVNPTIDSRILECIESGRQILRHDGNEWCLLSRYDIKCPHQNETLPPPHTDGGKYLQACEHYKKFKPRRRN